jgi:hypothetical protein
MPYDHAIASSPDDLAAQLERIFDDHPADAVTDHHPPDEDEGPPGEPSAAVDARASAASTELSHEMDLLRDQLEAAFAEVVGQVQGVNRRLAGVRQAVEAQTAAVDRLTERADATLALVQELVATLDAAVAASREPWEPEPLPVDLSPVVERLDHLDAAVSAAQRDLTRLHDVPLPIDTRRLEDVASRGSLHNAADIANLRRDLESLTDSARSQDKSLRDLRTTVDWIKDRLLR